VLYRLHELQITKSDRQEGLNGQNCPIRIELSEPTDAEMTQIQMQILGYSALVSRTAEERNHTIPDGTAPD
jgi:hypothetical protein